jgi:hypothetical protein
MPKKKETKDVLEMFGDFFREASVLTLVFLPIELSRTNKGTVPLPMVFIIGIGSLVLLLMGMACEKWRGE